MHCIQHSQSFVENGAENDLHSGGELQRKLREKEKREGYGGLGVRRGRWVSRGGEHLVSAISAKHSGGRFSSFHFLLHAWSLHVAPAGRFISLQSF